MIKYLIRYFNGKPIRAIWDADKAIWRYSAVDFIIVNEPSDHLDKNGKIIYEQKQLEIDFVASKFNKTYYIQCALSINDEDKMKQEKKPLEALKDGFEKIIIVKNRLKPTRDNKGIVIVDLFDFLLNSLDF